MTQETERYIELAQRVAAHAQAHMLTPETAVQFCEFILPDLLVELEIAKRIDAQLASRIAPPPTPPCEATICSSRWKAPEKAVKAKKKAAKKPRKKKGVKDDLTAS